MKLTNKQLCIVGIVYTLIIGGLMWIFRSNKFSVPIALILVGAGVFYIAIQLLANIPSED